MREQLAHHGLAEPAILVQDSVKSVLVRRLVKDSKHWLVGRVECVARQERSPLSRCRRNDIVCAVGALNTEQIALSVEGGRRRQHSRDRRALATNVGDDDAILLDGRNDIVGIVDDADRWVLGDERLDRSVQRRPRENGLLKHLEQLEVSVRREKLEIVNAQSSLANVPRLERERVDVGRNELRLTRLQEA